MEAADYDLEHAVNASSGIRQGLAGYGDPHFSLFLRKVFIKALGYSEDALSRPVIGIINTYSGFNPCHANVPQLIDAAKRGIQLAGGLAIDFPTISVHESFSSPTSMFLRNLMSMDTEEMIRAQPVDACIMIGGVSDIASLPRTHTLSLWANLSLCLSLSFSPTNPQAVTRRSPLKSWAVCLRTSPCCRSSPGP